MTEEDARTLALEMMRQSEAISLSALENYLAAAADLLRGSIDQSDFKAYIFPLMFFKRISDVYLEEYSEALEESGGDHEFAAFAENHRFILPEGSLWEDVRSRTENVGASLSSAFRKIEKANPETLYGIFGNAAWTNKERLPDSKLLNLIEHFSTKSLSSKNVPPDVFGQAYEYLIKRFADQSNKKAGEYYTPRSVVNLMVRILDPQEGESVYDPACGTGGMLIEVIQHVKSLGQRPQLLWGKLFGQEKVLATSAIARMNMLLHGVEDFEIVRGDTLRAPAFFDQDRLAKFECVIANPPFSLKNWGVDEWASDKYGRNKHGGTPPRAYADWGWVQHMLSSSLPDTGRVAVVLPQGALFRLGIEERIRRYLLEADKVEAVIGLAPNLFYGTPLSACILVLRHKKSASKRGKVLFVDGQSLYARGRKQNSLRSQHSEALLNAFHSFADEPGLTHVAPLEEIASNDFNLSISYYVSPLGEEADTLEAAISNLNARREEAETTRLAVEYQLTSWGLG